MAYIKDIICPHKPTQHFSSLSSVSASTAHLLAGRNVGAPRRRAPPRAGRRVPRHRRAVGVVPSLAGAVAVQRLRPVLLHRPSLPPGPLRGALRRRGRGLRRRRRARLSRPRPVLPGARGLALRRARAHGAVRAAGAVAVAAGWRGGGGPCRPRRRGRRAHGAVRQPAVRGRAGLGPGAARGGPAAAQRHVRHRALLLRHPPPPDRLAALPRRVRHRRRQERHAHRRCQGPREELPQRVLRRLLALRPVAAKAEGEREPRGLRRRPRAADAGPGLPADGPDVAAGQEQDGLHPHRLGRAARHALRRAPHRVRLRLRQDRRPGAEVQPRPGEHAARRRLAAVRAQQHGELGHRCCHGRAAGVHRCLPRPRALLDGRQMGSVVVLVKNR